MSRRVFGKELRNTHVFQPEVLASVSLVNPHRKCPAKYGRFQCGGRLPFSVLSSVHVSMYVVERLLPSLRHVSKTCFTPHSPLCFAQVPAGLLLEAPRVRGQPFLRLRRVVRGPLRAFGCVQGVGGKQVRRRRVELGFADTAVPRPAEVAQDRGPEVLG